MPKCTVSSKAEYAEHNGTPWFRAPRPSHCQDINSRVGWEIYSFFQYIRPTMEDHYLRRAIFLSIRDRILKHFGDTISRVHFYGSFSSNTYLPISDIDIIIHPRLGINATFTCLLDMIARLLISDGLVEEKCILIDRSRVPILKFDDSITGIPINISINPEHSQIRTTFIRVSFLFISFPSSILLLMSLFNFLRKLSNLTGS